MKEPIRESGTVVCYLRGLQRQMRVTVCSETPLIRWKMLKSIFSYENSEPIAEECYHASF